MSSSQGAAAKYFEWSDLIGQAGALSSGSGHTPGTSPYQFAHAPLGCQAVHALVVDTHLTGLAAQSMLSICSCQIYGELWLGYNLLFPGDLYEITEKVVIPITQLIRLSCDVYMKI